MNITQHKKVLKVALPAATNSLLDMLQIITDLIMVGTISAYAIAAVGLGLQSFMFLGAMLTLLPVGVNAVISRQYGAKKLRQASFTLSSMMMFSLLLSIPFLFIWYFGASEVFVLFGTENEVITLGSNYTKILTIMIPFVFIKMVMVSAISASGDTKTPLIVKIISIILNISLNYMLIFGNFGMPKLGVSGAAISTVIVNILEVLVYLVSYMKHKTVFTPTRYFSKTLFKRVLKVGLPASYERTLTFGSFMLFTAIIVNYGTEVMAGYQIGLRVEGIAFMPAIGFSLAAMVFMGQGIGAKNLDEAYSDTILILKYASSIMFFLSFFMIFTPEYLAVFFTNDKATIKEVSLYLQIVGVSQIPLAFNFVLSGALRGAGDSKRTLKINLLSLWFVRIIPAFTLSWYFENVMFVYFAMISDTFVKALFLYLAFKSGKWKNIKV